MLTLFKNAAYGPVQLLLKHKYDIFTDRDKCSCYASGTYSTRGAAKAKADTDHLGSFANSGHVDDMVHILWALYSEDGWSS
jgi:hypothetical protein